LAHQQNLVALPKRFEARSAIAFCEFESSQPSHAVRDVRRYKDEAIFGLNAIFALVTLCLLALYMVRAEAALADSQMMPLTVTATRVGP
jgi:hypothetical protein